MTISPPGIASVCNGDQLELMCNTTGRLLEWRFFQADETGTTREFARRGITADGPHDIQTFNQTVLNSTIFTFLRTSAQDSLVLTSKVVIRTVRDISLNGTVVICMDVASPSMESSSTTIMIINSHFQSMLQLIIIDFVYSKSKRIEWHNIY